MTDRITKPITAMKEYGRKPYLVTKDAVPYGERADYRYMMDTVWHKRQDNEQIVVQSVKKKPYQNSDYQAMEQGYDFPIFTIPHWNFNYDFTFDVTRTSIERTTTETEGIGLRWLQCPTTVSASKTYTIIVQNSSITTRSLIGGRTNSTTKQYLPTAFTLTKATSNAKGMVIYDLINKGSTTWITLGTASYASGSYYLKATDGNKTISNTISASSKEATIILRKSPSPYTYYKLRDIIGGGGDGYTVYTAQSVFLTADHGSYYQSVTTDIIDSYTRKYSYKNTMVWDDDTTIVTGDLIEVFDLAANSNISFTSRVGITVYAGYPPRLMSQHQTFKEDTGDTFNIQNGYKYYYRYNGDSVSLIEGTFSYLNSYGDEFYTGINYLARYFIDKNSNVMYGVDYDNSISAYVLSGMFSNDSFDIGLSWQPAVVFGLI